MWGVPERPDGLAYRPDLLDAAEERDLLAALEDLPLHEVRMHGQVARRTVRHFGFDYGYESWRLTPTDPLPEWLRDLRARCAAFAGLVPDDLAQTLVTRYPPGATIGWHRDAPMFGPVVVGVSLRSACVMRFQRRVGDERRVYEQELAPRSAYVLSGDARAVWQHSIPPVPDLRWSITFRTVRRRARTTDH
jgi:alkylated DNA repair dioxygenase AlkB